MEAKPGRIHIDPEKIDAKLDAPASSPCGVGSQIVLKPHRCPV